MRQLLGLGPFGLFTLYFVTWRICMIPNVTSLSMTAGASWSGGKAGWNISPWGELFSLCLNMIGGVAYLLILKFLFMTLCFGPYIAKSLSFCVRIRKEGESFLNSYLAPYLLSALKTPHNTSSSANIAPLILLLKP